MNLIKKECDATNKCYQNFFHNILTRAYKRGLEFYMQVLVEWLNDNNLDSDLLFEVSSS